MISKSELTEMLDKDYRHGLINAQIEVDLPLEIRALRKQRGWTQPDLAEKAEMKQPRISAMEKPGGANFTLETLKRLARAFDVALIVKFAPFSELLEWSDRFSPDDFNVPSFDKEISSIECASDSGAAYRDKREQIWEYINRSKLSPCTDELLAAAPDSGHIAPSWATRQEMEISKSVCKDLYPVVTDSSQRSNEVKVINDLRRPIQQNTMSMQFSESRGQLTGS